MGDDGVERGSGGKRTGHERIVAKDSDALGDLIPDDGARRSTAHRVGLGVLSVLLFAAGIVGWLVPVVTGVPFLVASAITAGMASRRVAHWINAKERKLSPKWRHRLRPKFLREWNRKRHERREGRKHRKHR